MPQTVTVLSRAQTAAKKLPVAESKLLAEFIRQLVLIGAPVTSAASTAHATVAPVLAQDKDQAFGGTTQLTFSTHHKAYYKLTGQALIITNLVSTEVHK